MLLTANQARAGIIGDEISGHFGPLAGMNLFYTSTAIVQDPGEEFRGLAGDFGEFGFVEAFVDVADGVLRVGFDTAHTTVHTGANLNYTFMVGDMDFGTDLRISDVTYVGNEGGGLFTGGGPTAWTVSHTDDSITFENVTGWSMHPGNQIIAVYEIGVEPDVAGDCTGDSTVDLADYTCFSDCITGPGATPSPECFGFDLDVDNDVDVRDFAYFQRLFGS
jgi:hypothetical protein